MKKPRTISQRKPWGKSSRLKPKIGLLADNKPKTIRHFIEDYPPINELGRERGCLNWFVRTEPTTEDACRGCAFNRRVCRHDCAATRFHFKKVNVGDILISTTGKKYVVVDKPQLAVELVMPF